MNTGVAYGFWKNSLFMAVTAAFINFMPYHEARADEMGPTSDALVSLEARSGWNMGARLQFDRRRLTTNGGELDLDVMQGFFRAGVRIAPFLHIWGEAGAARTDHSLFISGEPAAGDPAVRSRLELDGGTGFAWGIGAGASVFEYVIRRSPVVGRKESIAVEIDAIYRVAESDFDVETVDASAGPDGGSATENIDLKWKDARIAALFVYRLNQAGDNLWRPYEPTGYALRSGPVFSRVTGDFGEDSVREKNDFGALFGFDVRWESGWMGRFDVTWFSGNDREIAVGVHRFF